MVVFLVWIGVSHLEFLWIDSNGAMVSIYLSRQVDVLRETRLTMWYAFGLQPSGLYFREGASWMTIAH
jgi:hypothetical protein